MSGIERDLRGLAELVEFPATPPIAEHAAQRIGEQRLRKPRRIPDARRRLVLVTSCLVLLAGGIAVAASSAVRDGVLDLFRDEGVEVERTTTLPPAPSRAGELRLGRGATIDRAERLLGTRILVPRLPGRAAEVRLQGSGRRTVVNLAYADVRGLPVAGVTGLDLLVSEFRGDVGRRLVQKLVGPETVVRRTPVRGEPGLWIAGAPHDFYYRAPGEGIRNRTVRLAANVLVLERGPLLIRLEGGFGLADARALARSLRPFG